MQWCAKENGLRTRSRISHVFLLNVPTYPRPLLITDAAINIAPTLEDKFAHRPERNQPCPRARRGKAECRHSSAGRNINPKIPSTLEAAVLCKMADRGQITGGVLDGPLAFDNAISAEAAKTKGIDSPVAGAADILLVPDLESGNMLAKQLSFWPMPTRPASSWRQGADHPHQPRRQPAFAPGFMRRGRLCSPQLTATRTRRGRHDEG